jgi:hypothetical protein
MQPTVISHRLLPLAFCANKIMEVAVDFQNVLCPSLMMQPVDVLGKCPNPLEARFHFGDDLVGTVELCSSAALFNLAEIFPGQFGPSPKHFARQNVFNRKTLFGMLVVVETANSTIRRQAGIG